MIVHLTAAGAEVLDADDCTRLHVSTDLPDTAIDAALRSTGAGRSADDGSALLTLEVLRTLARAAGTADDWTGRWDSMIGYATAKGWVTKDGTAVKAHIEAPGRKQPC